MAESTLSVAYADLQKDVGQFLGYGRDTDAWSTANTTEVGEIIEAASRRFYGPQMVMGPGDPPHEWSFLRPVTELALFADVALDDDVTVTATYDDPTSTITASEASFYPAMVGRSIVITDVGTFVITGYTSSTVVTSTTADATATDKTFSITTDGLYGMPDDFGGWDGKPLTFDPDDGSGPPIKVVSEQSLRTIRQNGGDGTGPPSYVALRPRTFTAATGQRWDAMFWPTPDGEYTVSYLKFIQLDAMVSGNYVVGGVPCAEALRLLCRAEAEARMNDEEGLFEAKAVKALQAAVVWDRSHAPSFLGYNGDSSDGLGSGGGDRLHPHPDKYTTQNDTVWGD